jgi:hypothetical protein|tara:strand:- start:1259 stop:1495 length:237 start_codon:yes stop_codon:yes gene_type:complete
MVLGALFSSIAAGALSKALGFGEGGFIQKDGVYQLHKGEVVIPASEAKKMIAAYKKEYKIKKLDKRVLKPVKATNFKK